MARQPTHYDAPGVDHWLVRTARKVEDVGTFLGEGLAKVFIILYFLALAIPFMFVLWTLFTSPFQ